MREMFRRLLNGRYGSYGTDVLTRFLLGLAIVTLSLSVLCDGLSFLYYVAFLILVYSYFRLLSRNISKRSRENEKFKRALKSIKAIFIKRK